MRALAAMKPADRTPGPRPAAKPLRAHSLVHRALASPGRPLDVAESACLSRRLGHDFSRVRVHDDSVAAASAGSVGAAAYAIGDDVVLDVGRYRPGTPGGRQLLAHELSHVVQQEAAVAPRGVLEVEPANSAAEAEAKQAAAGLAAPRKQGGELRLMRADPDAVRQVLEQRAVAGAGIQFVPTNVTDTRIGPVSVGPGLLNPSASRLNVIVGENLTPRILARQLLPLWTTATPFVPPSGSPPVPPGPLSEEQLAQGLLVYNDTYLRLRAVPAMPNWRAGLRLPLPVEIDEVTGVATLNTEMIRLMAASFAPALAPTVDQRATPSAPPSAATVTAEVTAFLAAEPTALARGMALGARAVTNAQVALPFVREAFAQLGADGREVALAMMDELVNRDVSLLAAQRDGAAILTIVRNIFAAAGAGLSAEQQASLARANAMLARVAGVAAAAPAAAVRVRPERIVTVDTVRLDGSSVTPSTHVQVANAIFAQCNVRFAHGVDATASTAQTTGWIGHDRDLTVAPSCGAVSAEERTLYRGARAAFGLGARIQAFFVKDMLGVSAGTIANSIPAFCATGPAAPFRGVVVVQNVGHTDTLAHEIGHILLNSGTHPAATLMEANAPSPNELTNTQCNTIYANA